MLLSVDIKAALKNVRRDPRFQLAVETKKLGAKYTDELYNVKHLDKLDDEYCAGV